MQREPIEGDHETRRLVPTRTDFMDEDMRRFWTELDGERLPAGLWLSGGTALALYLGHRASKDFDFYTTTGIVDPSISEQHDWFGKGVRMRGALGGRGMMELHFEPIDAGDPERVIVVQAMEAEGMVPAPTHLPIRAPNGVPVAHPSDVVAGKLKAVRDRDELRDYEDVAVAVAHWPETCLAAAHIVIEQRLTNEVELAKRLVNRTAEIEDRLKREMKRDLERYAARLVTPEKGGFGWSR